MVQVMPLPPHYPLLH